MTRLVLISTCLLLLAIIPHSVLSLQCIANVCDTVRCANPPECGPGEARGKAGPCFCCDICRKVIGEGEDCSSESPIAGAVSNKVVCGEGLYCKSNKTCVKK